MTAYVVANVKVSNPDQFKQYAALTPEAIRSAGGEYIARGGEVTVLEGDWQPERMVVIRFNDVAAAKAFYDSALYQEAKGKRQGATEYFNMVIVDGL